MGVDTLNSFTNNTLADADLVNDNFSNLKVRLDVAPIEHFRQDLDNTTGLTFAYLGGIVSYDNVINIVAAGSFLLTVSTDNYIEVDETTGDTYCNTTGFTSGRRPLFEVTTDTGSITTVIDCRTMFDKDNVGDAFVPTGTGIPHIVSGVEQTAASLIVDADVDSAAGINATKIGGGGVSSTVFGYLAGVTSAIQTQFNALASSITSLTSSTTSAIAAAISGLVTGPGSSTGNNIATYADTTGLIIKDSGIGISTLAPLDSPALTGNPTAPTQTALNDSTKIATTAYVDSAVSAVSVGGGGSTPTGTGIPHIVSGVENGTASLIVDADVDSAAGINASKLSGGGVSNTVFNYLVGVTSAIQTQLNTLASSISSLASTIAGELATLVTGPGSSTDGDIVLFDGTSGFIVKESSTQLSSLAPLASPALTGNPTAPTQTLGDNSTKIATTAFVQANAGGGPILSTDISDLDTAVRDIMGDVLNDSSDIEFIPDVTGELIQAKLIGSTTKITAKLGLSSAQLIPTVTETAIVFDTVIFDTNSLTDVGVDGSKITVSEDGFYLFIANITCANPVAASIVLIENVVSGSIKSHSSQFLPLGAGEPGYLNLSGLLQLTAGDYVQVWFYQDSGSDLSVGGSGTEANSLSLIKF